MLKKLILVTISCFAYFLWSPIFATEFFPPAAQNLDAFTLRSVINAWGFAGDNLVGLGQGMIPIYGDEQQNLYGVAEGKIAAKNTGWSVGGGVGYRKIHDDILLGGYALLNYNRTPMANNYWTLNPGIEALTLNWDFRLNGYFPFCTKNWSTSQFTTAFASDIGNFNYVSFSGHDKFDRLIDITTTTREQAAMGLDGEVGRNIPILNNLKAFIEGYYYQTSDLDSVYGGGARITYQINNTIGLEARDIYDNFKHNTALIGVKLTLGGFSLHEQEQFGLSGRLLDPIEHNFATVGDGFTAPVKSQLNAQTLVPHQQNTLVGDNFWFFRPADATNLQGDGTFENPYIGFEPAMVTNIVAVDPGGANLYFAPGTYSLVNFKYYDPDEGEILGAFSVPANFALSGRNSNDYVQPADGNNRALFLGGFGIRSSNVTLDSLRMQSYPGSLPFIYSAVLIYGAQDVNLNNIEIGVMGEVTGAYERACTISYSDNVNLKSSNFYSYYFGVYILNSQLNFYNNNLINVYSSGSAYGVYETSNSEIKFLGDNNTITLNAADISYALNINFSSLFINGNNNVFSAVNNSATDEATAISAGNANIEINGNNNSFFSQSPFASYVAFASRTLLIINGNSNNFENHGVSKYAWGMDMQNYSTLKITGNSNNFRSIASELTREVRLYRNSILAILGNNNHIEATATNAAGGTAYGIKLDSQNNYLSILGSGNTINVDSADQAYGIWRDKSGDNEMEIIGASINVGQNGNPTHSYGIYIDSTNPADLTTENLVVKNTTFNIHEADGDGWGVFFNGTGMDQTLWNALVADNTFNGMPPYYRVRT